MGQVRQVQRWGYRMFLVLITTSLAIGLGWLGTLASRFYSEMLKRYGLQMAPGQQWLVDLGFVIIGVLLALLLGSWLTQHVWDLWQTIEEMPLADKVAVLFGVLIGLTLAYLVLLMPLMLLRTRLSPLTMLFIVTPITLILVYFSVHTLLKVRDALSTSFPQLPQILRIPSQSPDSDHHLPRPRDKILDTSVIIDGRLADIVRTGFIEGRLLVPSFVLNELQTIADSEDELRRARGKRGLSVLENLRGLTNAIVEIIDDFSHEVEAAPSVDLKLIRLAKERRAAIVTNDNNLQKIAELQGIPVLSVNELATALKPVVLPGEELAVVIQREGKEHGQGVGYLEDGTMVVVERGKSHIGHEVRVKVTSVLQTPMGKMIFGDFKEIIRPNVIKVERGEVFE